MTSDETFLAVGRKLTRLASLGASPDDIFRALVSMAIRMAVESSMSEEDFVALCRDAFVAGRASKGNGAPPS